MNIYTIATVVQSQFQLRFSDVVTRIP